MVRGGHVVGGSHKPPHSAGVKGAIRVWENRGGKAEGGHPPPSEDPSLPSRVLHLPISSKKSGEGVASHLPPKGRGEHNLAHSTNGYPVAAKGKQTQKQTC